MEGTNKKVLFLCSAQSWYTRNEFIMNFLQNRHKTTIICSDKENYLSRTIAVLIRYALLKNKKQYDFIVVGFFAQILIPFVRFLYSGEIISDFFISLYDSICFDRKKISSHSILGKLIYLYEKWTLSLSDKIITDTNANRKYFNKIFGINEEKVKVIYVLANEKLFYSQSAVKAPEKNINVFFYGSCQPLHGVDVILKAIKIINQKGIRDVSFTLVGPVERKYSGLAKQSDLQNVEFIDWVKYNDLPIYINKADICLGGHFGATDKAARVIAGKTFQFAAMKKPIILGDNVANREFFKDGENCLMIEMNNPEQLRSAILKLKDNLILREKISAGAYNTVLAALNYTKRLEL